MKTKSKIVIKVTAEEYESIHNIIEDWHFKSEKDMFKFMIMILNYGRSSHELIVKEEYMEYNKEENTQVKKEKRMVYTNDYWYKEKNKAKILDKDNRL